MIKRFVIGAIIAVAVGGAAFAGYLILGPGPTDFASGKSVALAQYRGADPTGVPAEMKSASALARGEYLARAADCVVCHTAPNGSPFAGGRAFVLPFGTIYSTNITPDVQTGIGAYSDHQFLDAVHRGVRADGAALYPAMPYPSYTYMSDADALAIKAYLFSLAPQRAPAPRNTLIFPFNQRLLMRVWAAMLNSNRRFEPNADRSPAWNRGAYLVEAMEHCGECHTPRNLAFALNQRAKFAGTVQAGWRAYNISSDTTSGVGAWSEQALHDYLATGHAAGHGTAAGPMGEAIDESMRHLTAGDISAMVTYLRTSPAVSTRDLGAIRSTPASIHHTEGVPADFASLGKQIYEGACVGCHDWTGVSPGVPFATLTGSRAVNDPTGTNLVQIVLGGGHRMSGNQVIAMPSFGEGYSDTQIASVANYVAARFGAQPAQLTAQSVGKLRDQD
jgi:mono/diheme cytochrome c family protein